MADTSLPIVVLSGRTVLLDDRLDAEPLTIFHGYCEAQRRRWCSTRIRGWQPGDSQVALDGEIVGAGEDPRIFTYNDWPAIVSVSVPPGEGPRTYLIECGPNSSSRWRLILPPGLREGKNYAPFVDHDGQLGFVHSYDPPVILREYRRDVGVLELVASGGLSAISEMGPHGYSAYRGGTNGVAVGRYILGVGHTTRAFPDGPRFLPDGSGIDYFRHRPYGWLLDLQSNDMLTFDVVGPFLPEFEGIDPTSLISLGDGKFELFTTEVERHFRERQGRRQVAAYHFQLSSDFLLQAARIFDHAKVQ